MWSIPQHASSQGGLLRIWLCCVEQKVSATDEESLPAGIEQCPHCGQSFANAVALVEHVERAHSRKELCVLC